LSTLNKLLIAAATEYEFKSAVEINKPRSWLKTVSAFSNGVGGSLYFGIDDKTHSVIGIEDVQKSADQISELIKMRIEPAETVSLEPIEIDGKHILRVRIPNGINTLYYYFGDGSKVAYYRVGNESVTAPAHILNELILKGDTRLLILSNLSTTFPTTAIPYLKPLISRKLITPLTNLKIIIRSVCLRE
jgi:ATP-dependent DNA helicase RecG